MIRTAFFASILFLLSGATALAQPPLDANTRRAVVERTAASLRADYIFPDVGERAATKIEAAIAAGEYEQITSVDAFADKVTADLRESTHDKHLNVLVAGAPPPAGPSGPPPRQAFGVVRADRLAGGVGYIEIVGFPAVGAFKPALDKALARLADSRALIIDVRRNHGGSPDGVAYLISYFMDPAKRTLINDFYARKSGTSEFTVRQTFSTPTAFSFVGRPLYVLTSSETFSGGEEFAYDVQAFKLGTLVGETTGGGANPGGVRPLTPQFSIFMPDGRPINPVTKTNWEGVGVIPEIAIRSSDALKAAMQRLGQQVTVGEIDGLSQATLFSPRTTKDPRSEAAVRALIEGLARGEPPYEAMTPTRAASARATAAGMARTLSPLGAIQQISFRGVDPQGADDYVVRLSRGTLNATLGIDDAGRIFGFGLNVAPADEASRMAAFKAEDRDGDGKLGKADYKAVLDRLGFGDQLESLFAQRDVNQDGFVSGEEYAAPIAQ